jgi:lactate dehydrogenase-like 2-hydroxyacid dehydrogenase
MFNLDLFRRFNPQAVFINVGRGDQVNEADLIQALDQDLLAAAILDVMSIEPLPADNPLWLHPGVQLTPHVSGFHLGDAIIDIAENYRRLKNGEPLLNLVDLERGQEPESRFNKGRCTARTQYQYPWHRFCGEYLLAWSADRLGPLYSHPGRA